MRLLTLLLSFVGLFAVSCEKPDDVTVIRNIIVESVDAAERQDINGLMEHVSREFVASPGNADEQRVRGVLLISFRRLGKFTVKHPEPSVTLGNDGNTAKASLTFVIVRGGQKFPDVSAVTDDPAAWLSKVQEAVGEPYKADLELQKTGDGWKVMKAEMTGMKRYNQL